MAPDNSSVDIIDHLKHLYAAYRRTKDIKLKGNYFSPTCLQVCRPQPSYAARDRETIVGYLLATADKGASLATESSNNQSKKGYYTIRPLRKDEFDFGTDEQVAPAGFTKASELMQKAEAEEWVGMRVDLWDVVEGKESEGMLVKVHYWWRKEEHGWIQILHDILYIGPKDGTEGSEGEVPE
ncbi:hypothetical protein V8C35DRAFT_40108 [Trichoderma chlorosporum]